MEFKEQIQRILENVPKVYDAGRGFATNEFSNALKGAKLGEAVAMPDVSPIEHDLGVRVSSKSLLDVSAVKLLAQGKNLIHYPYYDTTKTTNGITFTDNGDGSITMNRTSSARTVFYLSKKDIPINETSIFSGVSPNSGYIVEMKYIDAGGTTKYTNDSGSGRAFQKGDTIQFIYIVIESGVTLNNVTIYPQLEIGPSATAYEPYIEPVEYSVNADGSVSGLKSIFPCTTLMTDTEGALIECEYNRDINKAFAELQQAIISLGGNV